MGLENEARSDSELRRYVLGRLGDTVRSQLEERLAADDELLTRLGGVEQELVRDYLCGELSWWDKRRFRQRLRGSPNLRDKSETARAIIVALSPMTGGGVDPSRAFGRRARLPPRFGRAFGFGAVGVLFSVTIWLSVDSVRLRREMGRLEAERAAAAPAPVFSFVLSPGLSRGDSIARRLLVTGNRGQLRLRLEIPNSARYSHYRAGLRSVGQVSEAWSGMSGPPTRVPGGLFVETEIPIAGLVADDYVLSLQAPKTEADWEEVESYSFSVNKR